MNPAACTGSLIAVVLVLVGAVPAAAGKLQVATNGIDDATCGGTAQPCRSISQAIANALPGDTIEVGPGRYGDADGDGDFDDPGDEAAEIDTGCDCLILVPAGKRLTIVSRAGAGATLIDATLPVDAIDAIVIDAPGTVFGRPRRGFTLTGAGGDGLDTSAANVAVGGNVAIANDVNGFRIQGDGSQVVVNRALHNGAHGFNLDGASGGVTVGNAAFGNGANGFHDVESALIKGNLSVANGGAGFERNGSCGVQRGNVALGNGGPGFQVASRDLFTGNLAQANGRGVEVAGEDALLTKNAVIGNRGIGVFVRAGASGVVLSQSNVFGNNVVADLAAVNCGVASQSSSALDVARNFWGAATGPGADPADDVCPLVPVAGLVVEPVATKALGVKAKVAE